MNSSASKVYFVGAGPGDSRLLTLRGRDLLGRADVVIYDYLASPELLRWAPPQAELVCLGRHGTGRMMSQEEVNRRMVECALRGQTVVRLKGGDPAIFGRLAEEAAALRTAGVPFEVVPGITAAIAAGAYAGVTLTHRDTASCVALVTGREQTGKTSDSLDFAPLATFPGTLVFYMGVTTAPEWSGELLAHGKPADTPVRIVRRASLPEQQVWTCRLDQVAQLLAEHKVRPPAICIVGHVAENEHLGDWFFERPLHGQTVLVTRPLHQSEGMGDSLAELGARVLYQPAIEIGPPPSWTALDAALSQLGDFGWIVFSSRNGVDYFFDRLFHQGYDLRALADCRLATIGSGTSQRLAELHLRADLEPQEYRAEALAEALIPLARGKRCLLVRASRGREVLAETLAAGGALVEQVVAYESRDVTAADPDIANCMASGEITWTTVTSSAIARSLVHMFGEALRQTRLAAISPLTAEVLEGAGFPATVVAREYTAQGVVEAILDSQEKA